jgi:signal transduction histidine kinase
MANGKNGTMQTKFVMGNRWWDVLFGAAMALMVAINAFTHSPTTAQHALAFVILGLMTAAFVTLGRRSLTEKRFAVLFAAILVIGAGAAVACAPSLAIIQAICFPLIWVVIDNTRLAIFFNFLLAVAIAIGFLVSLGTSTENIVQSIVIEGISLVGSIALGLWISRIAELSTERQKLLDELRDAQGQLATLNRDHGVTSERERLSREIHDTIAQSLTGIVMLSQRAQRELAGNNLTAVAEQLALLEESARDALVETRSLVAASAPVELGSGIANALERLGERFSRETGIVVTVKAAALSLDRDTEVVLLRCAQEGLANARKHSAAKTATLTLSLNSTLSLNGTVDARPERIVLLVSDDGAGFDTGAESSGFGLPGLRQRLALAHGDLSLSSTIGAGTTLRASLPANTQPASSQPASTQPANTQPANTQSANASVAAQ